MKKFTAILAMFAVFLLGTPYLWQLGTLSEIGGIFAAPVSGTEKEAFKLLLTESGEIIEVSPVDYVTGCLFAQIPVSYHEEALKAQAVCAYTYALRMIRNNLLYPSEENKNADITDDPTTCQPYFNEEQAKKYYGDEYDLYYGKVREAAEYGTQHVITYKGEPIYSVYHSVSTGFTNTAYSVWGRDFPYLKSVASEWDREYRNFTCTSEISVEKVRVILLGYDRGITMPVDYSLWFTDYRNNEGGYVENLRVGDGTLSGGDMWRIFNLRSTDFKIEYTGTVFKITTKGYGHGVGLSQYGADYMAANGFNANEILTYYYTDAAVS